MHSNHDNTIYRHQCLNHDNIHEVGKCDGQSIFRRPQTTQGFSLIEVLVALLVLGLAMTTLISALLANTSLNTKVDRKAEAIRISEERLESFRQSGNYGTLIGKGTTTETVTRRGQQFTVQTTFCPTGVAPSMKCSTTAVYIRLDVKQGVTLLQRAETFYTSFGKEE